MNNFDRFYCSAMKQLEFMKENQRTNIGKAAEMFAACMNDNGIIQLVGVDHGRSFAMELGYRAGGLMPFHQFNAKDLALRGVLSQQDIKPQNFNNNPEYAQKLVDLYKIEPTDMFLCTSRTGCEPVLVEIAKMAKKHGHKVIAVVSKKASQKYMEMNPAADNILNYSDLILDTCTEEVDTVVDIDGRQKAGQLNTICGNVLAQMITAETYRYFKNHGIDCPVLFSANVTGADVHNRKISDKYLGRWNA